MDKSYLVVIPARYESKRFPGKPLIDIDGYPMIVRTAQQVEKAVGKDKTIVATDDIKIKNVVSSYGGLHQSMASLPAIQHQRVRSDARHCDGVLL